jgi:3-oxoacyl-[acyl-carrier protein] reductase
MRLKGKKTLITGAAQGIGKSIAVSMAREGADVAVADLNAGEAAVTARELKEFGVNSIAIGLDVSSADEVSTAFATYKKEFSGLDILVNNAGITKDALILRMKDSDWDSVVNINLKGTFLCSREAVKIMTKQQYGKIISVSSVVAFTGNPGQANYSASKAGIVGLTKTIAKEYSSRGIRANAVAPGFIQTAMTDTIPGKIREEMKMSIPLGHFGSPEDISGTVVFLASDDSDYITGQVFHINGGMYM